MKREGWLSLVTLLLLMAPPHARPTAWSGIIDPSRAIDWSSTGVGAAIVNRTTQCGPTIGAYSGPAATINSALASCTNGYVLLGPGTFALSTGINFGGHSNVTLRGSGPTQTIINFTGGDACGGNGGDICAINSTSYSACCSSQTQYGTGSNAANWTAGYAQGTTQITLSSTVGLSPGMTIFLDQQDDASDTNGVYVCQTYGPCGTDVPSGAGRSGRIQLEMKQIVAISGTVVTISPGLYNTNWRAAQSPGAWWVGPMLRGVGVENLQANYSGTGTTVHAGIYFFNCQDCWVRNVKSVDSNREHVWCYQSSNITVRDSYFYGTLNAASQSYGFETFMCADALVENNIFQHVTTPILFHAATGSVVGYNYNTDDYYSSPGWQINGTDVHGAGTSFNLWEGNQMTGFMADAIHGSHNQETLFRNWESGLDTCSGVPCNQQTVPILLYTHTRGYNIIGNVLGTPGYHTNYEGSYAAGTTKNPNHAIYVIGYCANVSSIHPSACSVDGRTMPNDPPSSTTLFRWGNYDTATDTVRWASSEVPTTSVPYMNGNPVPSSQTLPMSFYLVSRPTWWGSMPWPAIGPDVSGGTGPGGHAHWIPTAVCYNKTAKDSSGILSFDANACYGQQPRALPPSQLH